MKEVLSSDDVYNCGLDRPLDRPLDREVVEICRGQVQRLCTESSLPDAVADTFFFPAPLMPDHDAVIDALAETATQCAPWLCIYLGPKVGRLYTEERAKQDKTAFPEWSQLDDGRIVYRVGGLACAEEGIVLSQTCCSMSNALSVLHHELWHAIEPKLSHNSIAIVDRACGNHGRWYPGDYLSSPKERRARLYQAWSSAMDEGYASTTVGGRHAQPLDEIFWYVRNGSLARDIAEQERRANVLKPVEKPGLLKRLIAAI